MQKRNTSNQERKVQEDPPALEHTAVAGSRGWVRGGGGGWVGGLGGARS